MSKTIDNAVSNLEPKIAHRIKELFRITNCMDLYDGELEMYLGAIQSTLDT